MFMLGLAKKAHVARPLPVTLTRLLTVDAHDAVSARLGIFCPAREELKFKNFLLENEISLFDYVSVHRYMNRQAKTQGKLWGWVPLREQDDGDGNCDSRRQDDRYIQAFDLTASDSSHANSWLIRSGEIYSKLVPTKILLDVEKIQWAFPTSRFFVSEVKNFPDPFMAVILPRIGIYVIGVWDEPGFGS
jgi:hypothetical protein